MAVKDIATLDIVAKSIKTTDNSVSPDFETADSGWDDAILFFVGKNLDVTSGRVDFDREKVALKFQSSATEADAIVYTYQLLHKHVGTPELRPHAHLWEETTSNMGWKMKYRICENFKAVGSWSAEQDCTYGHARTATPSSGSPYINIITFPSIDISSLTISDLIDVKFYRDDSISEDAWLKQADFHVQEKRLTGSRNEWS